MNKIKVIRITILSIAISIIGFYLISEINSEMNESDSNKIKLPITKISYTDHEAIDRFMESNSHLNRSLITYHEYFDANGELIQTEIETTESVGVEDDE